MKLRVEYIKRPHKNKIYSYPFVVSSYRDKRGISQRKIHLNLSKLPENTVEAIKVSLENQDKQLDESEKVSVGFIKYKKSKPFGNYWAVVCLLEQIGIMKSLRVLPETHQVAIITSIIDRVINPKPYSKRALSDWYEKSVVKDIIGSDLELSQSDWYTSLETLFEHQMYIQKSIFNKKVKNIYLYDITSSYFEGEHCPLADWGYDRDKKKGKRIIVIGLLTTEDGCPIAVRVFRGNTSDQTTVINQVQELKNEFGIEQLIFVGDRGMITGKRIEELEKEEFNWCKYITAIKRSEMMRFVENEDHPVQLGLFDHQNLVEVEENGKRYVLCYNPLRKNEDSATRLVLLKKTEEKLKSISNNVKDGRLKKEDKIAKRLYTWLNKWNMGRFFSVNYSEGCFEYKQLEDEIERYSVLDGCYVIVSNVEKEEISTEGLRDKYKDLKYVENAFRTMKTTDLFLRPIRHWNPERVKGHVFMCMIAYRITWEVRQRLHSILERDEVTRECEGDSLREIWDELNEISIGTISIAGSEVKGFSELSSDQHRILKLLKSSIGKKANELLK